MQFVIAVPRVLRQRLLSQLLCCLSLAAVPFDRACAAEAEPQKSEEEATAVDLSSAYQISFAQRPFFKTFTGRQVIDNLPFQIDGLVLLYGKTEASRSSKPLPDTVKGIRIGRKFDDLYMIHYTSWPDVEGQTVAYVCLNYADGTESIFPVRYGFQVRDVNNLPSYEKETMADPATTICWRHAPVKYKAPVRIFKSKFVNPSPEKVVETMDIISARNLAAYYLLAATVANRHAAETPEFTGDRHFDGKLTIRVVDDVTGDPIAGALVMPSMYVVGEGVVGSPFVTSASGEGSIPYPIKDTTSIYATAEKEGYKSEGNGWSTPIPGTFTFRLKPINAESP